MTGKGKGPPSGGPKQAVQYSSRQTAWAAMPSPLPVKPRPSSVVAFTLTWEAAIPQAFASYSRICGI